MRTLRPGALKGATDRLSIRLLILLSVALLPLGAISFSATLELTRAAQRTGERSLIAQTADSLAGERALVESALASADAIRSLVLERLDDPQACNTLLRDYVERSNIYSLIAFIGVDGVSQCISGGEVLNFGESPMFQGLRDVPMTMISASPSGRSTGVPVVIVTRPVFEDGSLAGFLSVSITRRSMELLGQRRLADAPAVSVLLNREGEVLSLDPEGDQMAQLPGSQALRRMTGQAGSNVYHDRTRAGRPAVYAVAELIPRQLYGLAMWEENADQLSVLQTSALPLVFPAVMWLSSLAVVLFSVHYLVLRHLRSLNRQVRRFALGQREPWAELAGHVPSEIRDLQSTFRNMSRLITRDELEREKALVEKTVLLKELHHRVKNNLQLIASIINLQLRQIDDAEARRVLHGVQERVLGLATVHRALYGEEHLAHVRADRVIEEITGRIGRLGTAPNKTPTLNLKLQPLTLDADHMVPLTFVLNEGLTNALKYMGAGAAAQPGHGWIDVELYLEPPTGEDTSGAVVLRMLNPLPSDAAARHVDTAGGDGDHDPSGDGRMKRSTAASGLGRDLIEAFALQLNGTLHLAPAHDAQRGPVWELLLRFPAPAGAVLVEPAPPA
ncbi:MAG: sensor histidine kinase [Pararhodobacter sp.]|nr:sensor histidine kinase [Pararhodobacter sp.]